MSDANENKLNETLHNFIVAYTKTKAQIRTAHS